MKKYVAGRCAGAAQIATWPITQFILRWRSCHGAGNPMLRIYLVGLQIKCVINKNGLNYYLKTVVVDYRITFRFHRCQTHHSYFNCLDKIRFLLKIQLYLPCLSRYRSRSLGNPAQCDSVVKIGKSQNRARCPTACCPAARVRFPAPPPRPLCEKTEGKCTQSNFPRPRPFCRKSSFILIENIFQLRWNEDEICINIHYLYI
jgi:hypothetical protein